MHPTKTNYFLCASPADYRACHALWKAQGGPTSPLQFPTVYATREGHTIGFLSSNNKHHVLMAGPLVLSPDLSKPVFTALRLVESYENVLRRAGVKHYFFHVDKTKPDWKTIITRCGLEPKRETDTAWFFVKELS